MSQEIIHAKQECRQHAATMRKQAYQTDQQQPQESQASQRIITHFFDHFPDNAGKIVSGYAAIHSELPLWDLLEALAQAQARLCLPVVWKKDTFLQFRAWRRDEPLIKGAFGASIPKEDAKQLIPDIILLPLLGFARDGIRLGYGGGYYDRTVEEIRTKQQRKTILIGVGYQAQQFDTLPYDRYDCKCDYILSEEGLTAFV